MNNALMKEYLDSESIIFYYCLCFDLCSGERIFITDAEQDILLDGTRYSAKLGLKVTKIVANEGGQDYIELELFKGNSTTPEELLNASVRVSIFLPEKKTYFHFYTMNVAYVSEKCLELHVKLEPITSKLQKASLYTYSRTCRAEFGDLKCKINKELYSVNLVVDKIEENRIILEDCKEENNYYTAGEVTFVGGAVIKITSHSGKILKCDKVIPIRLRDAKMVKVTAGCDKKFTTCCNKFNNAINFRGEPSIPGNKILKL
jgi:uncharacterized phage protein (TIGR02218 family)